MTGDRALSQLVPLALVIGPVCAVAPVLFGVVLSDPRALIPFNSIALLNVGYAGGVVIAYVWSVRAHRAALASVRELFLSVVLFFAGVLAFETIPDEDYQRDVDAAARWLEGEPLFQADGTTHPPLTAQLLAGAFIALRSVASSETSLPGGSYWFAVYVGHQVLQLMFVTILFWLAYRVCRRAGAAEQQSALVAALGLLLCQPLREALGHNQISIAALVCAMGSIDLVARGRPALAGAAAAFGGLLKLYPFVLAIDWMLSRRTRAIAVAGAVCIAAVLVSPGAWLDWIAYLGRLDTVTRPRDASLRSLIMNGMFAVGPPLGLSPAQFIPLATGFWLVAVAGILAGLLSFLRRTMSVPAAAPWAEPMLLAGVVLCFPLAWSHHYVFALPLGLMLAVRSRSRRAWLGVMLALVAPAVDVFPLGVHRGVGLVLAMSSLWPRGDEDL